jgi:hypothetical protein
MLDAGRRAQTFPDVVRGDWHHTAACAIIRSTARAVSKTDDRMVQIHAVVISDVEQLLWI